jgi:hypothetical protein
MRFRPERADSGSREPSSSTSESYSASTVAESRRATASYTLRTISTSRCDTHGVSRSRGRYCSSSGAALRARLIEAPDRWWFARDAAAARNRDTRLVSEENVEVIRRLWEAVGRRDREAVFASYDPDIVWQNQPVARWSSKMSPIGHEAVRQFWRDCRDQGRSAGGRRSA